MTNGNAANWDCLGVAGRSVRPSQARRPAGRQHHADWRGPAERPAELDAAGGAGHPRPSLQSVLELDGAHQVHGAIQEEEEEDHPRGKSSQR